MGVCTQKMSRDGCALQEPAQRKRDGARRTTYGGSTAAADYPGMGMDGSNIYITSNQIVFKSGLFQGARVLVIPKSSIYPNAGTGSCPTATSTDFPHLLNPDGSKTYSVQPANELDALPGQTSPPMYLVNSRASGSSQIIVRPVSTGPVLNAPYAVNVSKYDTPANAPQPNGQAIYSGDVTLLGAVYRYGNIYTANNTRTVSTGTTPNPYSSVQWYTLTPGSPTGVTRTITNASPWRFTCPRSSWAVRRPPVPVRRPSWPWSLPAQASRSLRPCSASSQTAARPFYIPALADGRIKVPGEIIQERQSILRTPPWCGWRESTSRHRHRGVRQLDPHVQRVKRRAKWMNRSVELTDRRGQSPQ